MMLLLARPSIVLLFVLSPACHGFVLRQRRAAKISHGDFFMAQKLFSISDKEDERFQDLATALRRMQTLQTIKDFNMGVPRKLVKVGPSSIDGAGMGVFAMNNIKAGTIVGFFPVHALGVEFDDETTFCLAGCREDQPYFDRPLAEKTEEANYVHYLMGSRRIGSADFGSSRLYIDVKPNRPLGDRWIGHLVNDGATVRSNSEQGMLDYYAASRKRKNCVNIPFASSPILATVTTRDVKKNEELFTSYGCMYWIDALIEGGEICADVTEAVLLEAKSTAQDLFDTMRTVCKMYATQQDELQDQFAKL